MKTNINVASSNADNRRTPNRKRYARSWAIAACAIGMTCSVIGAESVSFTRITQGAIATDRQQFMAVAWGDYDGDGDLDVYFTSTGGHVGALYRNAGLGAFERVASVPITTDANFGIGCAWADFDNDGDLDLFRSNWISEPSRFYRNDGATFSRVLLGSAQDRSMGVAWGDYDNDGHLDLFLPSGGVGRFSTRLPGNLYHNDGRGRLTKMPASTVGPIASTSASGISGVWSDFNGDGLLDLFVANYGEPNSLFLNSPDHRFVRVTEGALVQDSGSFTSCALGDYDNDGDLDLFVANGSSSQPSSLYRNDGGGKFSKVLEGRVASDTGQSLGAAWADYDNDGWLDLFVANGESVQENNFLYRNNGDGTFTRVLEGSVANDGGASMGCAWGDYDNDGFLDLIVANGALRATGFEPNLPEVNFLYHNDAGNGNRWIRIKCVGTASNRSGIGAKVRVRATIAGKTFWQLREISSGNGFCGNAIDAHFGLGDADRVDLLRVEWPSGIVQEFHDLSVNRSLTLTEPARLQVTGPGAFRVQSWKGMVFEVQASADLKQWSPVTTVTNLTGTLEFTDPDAAKQSQHFFRTALK